MKKLTRGLILTSATLAICGCAGAPVALGSRVSGPVPIGEERVITGEACGFQLFMFIPIAVNGRLASAYSELEEKAGGDFITDVTVEESWGYRFVGTAYCTTLKAKAIRKL